MAKATFCNTCIFWEKDIFTRAGGRFGICNNPTVSDEIALDGKTHMQEEGTFYTSENFGCVHWRDSHGVLIDTSAIVKNIIK